MIFSSDNWAGVSSKVMAAIGTLGAGFRPAYGNDDTTRRLTARMSELFERDVAVFLVTSGTAANALSIAAFSPPWGAAIGSDLAHFGEDECGAIEFFAGIRVQGVVARDGKMTPEALAASLERFSPGFVHHSQPSVVSVSNATELGTVYAPDEIRAIAEIAGRRGCKLHMDGARFANAVAATGATPAELTWKSGVDVLSFGGTKGGCMLAEAVVLFDTSKAEALGYLRKRAGQLLSKQAFLSVQFEAWLEDGHWLDLARHANAMAARLAVGIRGSSTSRLAVEPVANEVFFVTDVATDARLKAAGAVYHEWPARQIADLVLAPGESLHRLVTSFATVAADVDRFVGLLGSR